MRPKSRAKKRNKYKPESRANYVKGLVISWTDINPLNEASEIMPGAVTHRNAIHRLNANRIFFEVKQVMMFKTPFAWKITITVVFDYGNSVQREVRELRAFSTLGEIDGVCNDSIEDCMRHGSTDKYLHTEFVVECTGHHQQINFNVDNELKEIMA